MHQVSNSRNVLSLAVAVLLICGLTSFAQAAAPASSAMRLIQSPSLAAASISTLAPSSLGSETSLGLNATLSEEAVAAPNAALLQSALPDPTPLLVLLVGSIGLVWSKPRH